MFTIEKIPKIRHYITEEEYEEALSKTEGINLAEIARRCWVLLQSYLILYWVYKGFKYYNRVQTGFTRTKLVLGLQAAIVIYLLINEFILSNLLGIFLMLAFAHYVNFLTFTLVVDSC